MDKLKQIETFIAMMEHGNMAAAVPIQDMTPAMIGRRINTLEVCLDMRLLHWSMRYITATEQGAVFMGQCKKALGELGRVELLVIEGYHKTTGHPIVSTPATFGREHVAPHAPDFLHANPDMRISFNLTDRVVDLVHEDYDVGICIGGAISPNFAVICLASNKRIVCSVPICFTKHGVPRTLDDLARHNCLAFDLQGDQQHGWYFQQSGKAVIAEMDGNLDCNDSELLRRWMDEDLGLGWRPVWEIQPKLEPGALTTVLDDCALSDYGILAMYPQQQPVSTKIRFFTEYLEAVYGQTGYWSRTA